jgi:beta-aspartyl-peptidase (threonine type)
MMRSDSRWVLILHGGAKEISPAQADANRSGCLAALARGTAVLRRGGAATEATEAVIRVLEDDPTFNAGRGSAHNAKGEIEMDAALMDGTTLDIGSIAAIRGVRHPISIARLVLSEPPTLLVADGALRFAIKHGHVPERTESGISLPPSAAHRDRRDTVGCVALDRDGHLAAGTSTGGLPGTHPGRVGDSPLPGCGFYADDHAGAVVFSGDGEHIARLMLAARVIQHLEAGQTPQAAVELALRGLERIGGEAGGIVLNRHGRFGWAHNSPDFAVAWASSTIDGSAVHLRRGTGDERCV